LKNRKKRRAGGFGLYWNVHEETEKKIPYDWTNKKSKKKFKKAFDKAYKEAKAKLEPKPQKPKPIVTKQNRNMWAKALRGCEMSYMEGWLIPKKHKKSFWKSYFKHSTQDTKKEFRKLLAKDAFET